MPEETPSNPEALGEQRRRLVERAAQIVERALPRLVVAGYVPEDTIFIVLFQDTAAGRRLTRRLFRQELQEMRADDGPLLVLLDRFIGVAYHLDELLALAGTADGADHVDGTLLIWIIEEQQALIRQPYRLDPLEPEATS